MVEQQKNDFFICKNNIWLCYKNNIKLSYCNEELCFEGCLINLVDSCIDMFHLLKIISANEKQFIIDIGKRKQLDFAGIELSQFISCTIEAFLEKYQSFRVQLGKFSLNADSFYKFKRKNKKYFLKV